MGPNDDRQDRLLFELGLALLQLINRPIDLELSKPQTPGGLILSGTLLRAFDTPAQASLSITIGAHTIAIRPSTLKSVHITRHNHHPNQIQSIHLFLTDQFALHIKPIAKQTSTNFQPPNPNL